MMEWIRKNDMFTRLLSLFFAIAFWFFVVSSEDKDVTTTVSNFPVEFTGSELLANNDLIITEGARSEVAFKISGKTSVVSNVDLDYIRAQADLSNITAPGTYDVKYQLSTTIADIQFTKLGSSVKLVVDRMVSRSIPVELTLGGKLEEGYILDRYNIKPDAILVTGPQSVLDTIDCAKAAYDISDLTESTETTIGYALVDKDGKEVTSSFMSVNTPSIELEVVIRQSGEIPLVLNVNDYGFITAEDIDIRLEPQSIKVNGSPEVISTLNQIDIGTVNLETIFANENFEFELPLILPNGITSEMEVSKVKVVIDPLDIQKAIIEVEPESLPQSELFTYVSGLSIEVWADKDHIASLNENSINIEVAYDPEDLQGEFNELPVKITAIDENINIIGEYKVVVEVAENTTDE